MDPASDQQPALAALGLDIGHSWARVEPVVSAFAERGFTISKRTIGDLRGGRLNGRTLAMRFAAIERLHANDASLKTAFALRLLRTAAELRAPSGLEVRPYVTRGLSGAGCAVAGCTRPDFNRVVSGLRADFALWAS